MRRSSTKLWVFVAVLFILVAISFAYVLTGYKWPVGSVVPYYINANTAQVTNEASAVNNAADSWSQIYPAGLRLSYAGSVSVTGSFLDGKNTICWKNRGNISALATTYSWIWVGTNTLAETDIVFNDYHPWFTSGSNYDIETVALHELGHVVGLTHSPTGIMFWQYSGIQQSIDSDARAGFEAMYGSVSTTYSLTLTSGTGGTTSPSPGTYTYDEGTNVNVTAVPDSGYRFSGWSGDASGTTNPITITMNSNKSIKANFTPSTSEPTLTISSSAGGTTDPSPGSYTYAEGTQVTITAIPDSGYDFSGWSGDASGTTNPITITMDSDKSISANFVGEGTGYTLTIASGDGGTTDPSPGTYTYSEGTEVTITASPDSGYEFSEWTGDASGSNNPITLTMDSNKSITANFTLPTSRLTISTGTGGTTNPTPGTYTYEEGTEVTITATPDSGYRFDSWTGDIPSGHENDNPLTITMDSDKSITANFIKQYTLTLASGTGGTTDPVAGTYTYDSGTEVTVTATADNNYRFKEWSGDASGTTNPISITMDSDKTVTANFIRQYKLTLAAGEGGTTDPSPGTHIYDEGTKVIVTAVPDSWYRFDRWSGDASGTTNPITITMNSDKSVTASFIRLYKLTITAGQGGTTDPVPGTHIYDEGTKVATTATPDSHYIFNGWTGDASGVTNPITITMDSDKSIMANFIKINPPLNFTGKRVENRALARREYINVLTWEQNPKNKEGRIKIVKYRIFYSGQLLAEVNADTFEYLHHGVQKYYTYVYEIVAVDETGVESEHINTIVYKE